MVGWFAIAGVAGVRPAPQKSIFLSDIANAWVAHIYLAFHRDSETRMARRIHQIAYVEKR